MTDPVIVVGGGQAAVQLCLALRKEKYDGAIIMYSAESEFPYHRPPLSKAYITGKADDAKLPMRPESFYSAKNIDLRLNDEITSVDIASKTVTGNSGKQKYSSLVLATGAIARVLSLEGRESKGVFELRDIGDARAIRSILADAKNIVVIGAGFIGLEVAAAANQLGKKVTVFDTADRVMGRAVAPQTSEWFEQAHRDAGIEIHLKEGVRRIVSEGDSVTGVQRGNGDIISADMVLIGIGVLPNSELAESAGLECENGVLVDQYCRTSNPHVFAAGDCACHPNVFADNRRVRLESIQNATDQARVIAAIIAATVGQSLGVDPEFTPYNAVPWFWSDQAEHSLQMAGLAFDADLHIQRGDPAAGSFSIFHFREQRLLAVDSINASRDHMVARKLLASRISPTVQQVEDSGVNLMGLVKAAIK